MIEFFLFLSLPILFRVTIIRIYMYSFTMDAVKSTQNLRHNLSGVPCVGWWGQFVWDTGIKGGVLHVEI